jgi:hypothetical protein
VLTDMTNIHGIQIMLWEEEITDFIWHLFSTSGLMYFLLDGLM